MNITVYCCERKKILLKYAVQNDNQAERKFGVSKMLVRDWKKGRGKSYCNEETKEANHGLKANWPELEE